MPKPKPVGSRRVSRSGYVQIKVEGCNHRWPWEHHVVWEEANGPLPEGWCIHHVDGNRLNNSLDNLLACAGWGEHQAIHSGSEEGRERARQMGLARRGATQTPEARAKIAAAHTGRQKSPEQRALLAKVLAGDKPKREPRWKQSVKMTDEQRAARSERTKRFYTEHPEARKAMSERMRAKWARATETVDAE